MEPATPTWTLFIDRLATLERDEVRIVLKGSNNQLYEHALRFEFKITNNDAEYEALLSRLQFAQELHMKELEVLNDS